MRNPFFFESDKYWKYVPAPRIKAWHQLLLLTTFWIFSTGLYSQSASDPNKSLDFEKLITSYAIKDSGIINVYIQDGKHYLEIADSLLGQPFLVVSRIGNAPAGRDIHLITGYPGDQVSNSTVIQFDKGPKNKLLVREVVYDQRTAGPLTGLEMAVLRNNTPGIIGAFDIKARSFNNRGYIIDCTSFFEGDNLLISFDKIKKTEWQLGILEAEKSFINSVTSYPDNIFISTTKTYTYNKQSIPPAKPFPNALTFVINTTILHLPKQLMNPRYADRRVGYDTVSFIHFEGSKHGYKKTNYITRWRILPKLADYERYAKHQLVPPEKPIVFYIDAATPPKWVPYLIQGVEDWRPVFEKIGFKNAITAKMAPSASDDSKWSLHDARYSTIVYESSIVKNALFTNIVDPRSGEIISSQIRWHHNMLSMLQDWYIVQASPSDIKAQTLELSDTLMGRLVRMICNHEVGHSLGLLHNYGASSAYPVEKLRDKNWLKENGISPSIMDYNRFNYIAQPTDGLTTEEICTRISYYDQWAIEWGYKPAGLHLTAEAEKKVLDQWVRTKSEDKTFWFSKSLPFPDDDPRSQAEDLGDDAVKASQYGLKNLQFVVSRINQWQEQSYASNPERLQELSNNIIDQYENYMWHVARNIGGIYEYRNFSGQYKYEYRPVAAAMQKECALFLYKNLFTTPFWLVNPLYKISGPDVIKRICKIQENILEKILSSSTLAKLTTFNFTEQARHEYNAAELLKDIKKSIWTYPIEKKKISYWKINLQIHYIGALERLLNLQKADYNQLAIAGIVREELISLLKDIKFEKNNTNTENDQLVHMNQLEYRINRLLE